MILLNIMTEQFVPARKPRMKFKKGNKTYKIKQEQVHAFNIAVCCKKYKYLYSKEFCAVEVCVLGLWVFKAVPGEGM